MKQRPQINPAIETDTIDSDLRSQLRFCRDTGNIWLRENRMLLVHAHARGRMRRELIDSFGMEVAQGLFFRMGYASGVSDYDLTRLSTDTTSDEEAFITGPSVYALEGGVKTTVKNLDVDRKAGKFNSEIICEHSWEGQAHLRDYGESSEGVCWYLIGYASGWTSAFMGSSILWKEVGCIAKDLNYCTLVGKPIEEWDDTEEYKRILNQESLTESLISPYLSKSQNKTTNKNKLPSELIGESPRFQNAYNLLTQASNSQITVLLQGETGVGKEVFARLLHENGARNSNPFIAVNCAAIPADLVEAELFGVEKGAYTGAHVSRPGRFQRANGGTLFLDEVGDMPLSAQAKLLRVLQEGEVECVGGTSTINIDVRLVAASNIDLRQLVEQGKFRADLYYRINAFQINIPPLREREFDVLLIAKKFLKKYSAINGKKFRGFSDKAKQVLINHNWPGNIRELQNVIERSTLLAPDGGHIETKHLSPAEAGYSSYEFTLDADGGLSESQQEIGKNFFEAILKNKVTLEQVNTMLAEAAVGKANGNLSAAARMLGLTRAQLAYRLERKAKPSKLESE